MNIQSYLPSRKIRIALIGILIIGIAYLIFFFIKKKTTPQEKTFIDVTLVDDTNTNYTDTDGDGAYDHIEILWGLDPENPDTDGDGVLDGKYIKTKQDIQERERRGVQLIESNLTESEKLGRSAYTALLAIAQSGGEWNTETEEQFSENIAGYINDLTLGDKIYTRDELLLVEDSKENIYAYRDAMKILFEQYPVATSDIETILEAADNPIDFEYDLQPLSLKYSEYLIELTAIETPYVIAGRHTELINNISQISGAVNNLLDEEADELVSLAFLVQIQDILDQTAEAIININTFFEIIEDESLLNN